MQNQFFAQSFAEPLAHNTGQPRKERPPKSPRHRTVRPAIFAAHRRRTVRRSAYSSPLPRSGTLPNMKITPGLAASTLVSSSAAAFVPTRPATGTPTKAPRLPEYATPPRRTLAPAGSKRKGPGFGRLFRPKEHNNPSELPDGALSPKARRVLGLPSADSESSSIAESSLSSEGVYRPPVHIDSLSQGFAACELVDKTEEAKCERRALDFRSNVTFVSETPMNNLWKESKMKALNWLGHEESKEPKSAGLRLESPSAARINTKTGYYSDGPAVPRTRVARSALARRRRIRKKRGKSIEKMSPITELSSASSCSDTGDGADAELDVISEYGRAFHLRRSMTAPLISRIELHASPTKAPEEQGYDAEVEDTEQDEAPSYTQSLFRYDTELQRQVSTPASISEKIRELCLHATPEELQETERILADTLRYNELEGRKIAAEHLRLQREHSNFKAELLALQGQSMAAHDQHEWVNRVPNLDGPDSGGDSEESLVPLADYDESDDKSNDDVIEGDIETDEEPTVYIAEAVVVSALRVTPEMNMIKLVDIQPQKVKPVEVPLKLPPRNPKRFGYAVDVDVTNVKALDDAHHFERHGTAAFDGQIPKPALTEEVTALPGCNSVAAGIPAIRGGRVSRGTHPFNQKNPPSYYSYVQSPVSPPYGHFRSSGFAYAKEKKAKLPKEQSRNFVTGWLENSSTAAQRPISMLVDSLRLDPDVLADQNLDRAPVPPPKDATSAKNASRHFCVTHGHLFTPIDLREAPDDVAVNQLQVQPYLRTPNGVKQHVHIPVNCERCGKDVNEVIWECRESVQAGCLLCLCSRYANGL